MKIRFRLVKDWFCLVKKINSALLKVVFFGGYLNITLRVSMRKEGNLLLQDLNYHQETTWNLHACQSLSKVNLPPWDGNGDLKLSGLWSLPIPVRDWQEDLNVCQSLKFYWIGSAIREETLEACRTLEFARLWKLPMQYQAESGKSELQICLKEAGFGVCYKFHKKGRIEICLRLMLLVLIY